VLFSAKYKTEYRITESFFSILFFRKIKYQYHLHQKKIEKEEREREREIYARLVLEERKTKFL